MSWDRDAAIDRRRLKRRLRVWQAVALLALVAIVLAGLHQRDMLLKDERLARIHVNGFITADASRTAALRRIAADPSIRGLIVHLNSPGGSIVGGEELYKALREVAERKPVAAVMGTVAASGAYMAAVGTDRIYAHEGTVTGSIGVMLQTADVTRLLDSLGVEPIAIKSGELKGVPSPLETLDEGGREAARRVVLDMYDLFVDTVAQRRALSPEATRTVADGRIFTGRQAVANGLIDAIGDERSAVAWMTAAHGVPAGLRVETVSIGEGTATLRDLLLGLAGKSLFSNALTLDGLIAVWQPAVR